MFGVVVGIEVECKFVGGNEDDVLVFLLLVFHLLEHFLAHVGPDLNVDAVVGGSLGIFLCF